MAAAVASQAVGSPSAGMRFRPCIDLHDGKVKQIVGATLTDAAAAGGSTQPVENFVATKPPAFFAELYRRDNLPGGHVIMLGKGNEGAALEALQAYPGGMQVGGGINPTNAQRYLDAGASHVIVTSFVFKDGHISTENLTQMVDAVGKDRLVLDLSCRKRPAEEGVESDGLYYVVTDRWQKFTSLALTPETLRDLAQHCNEFLVHGVEVEGLRCGILDDLVEFLGASSPVPVTYAGGARSLEDLQRVRDIGAGRVDLTIGSALDVFGGDLPYDDVVAWQRAEETGTARPQPGTAGAGTGGASAGE